LRFSWLHPVRLSSEIAREIKKVAEVGRATLRQGVDYMKASF